MRKTLAITLLSLALGISVLSRAPNPFTQMSVYDVSGQFVETVDVSGLPTYKAVTQAAITQSGNGKACILGTGGTVGIAGAGGLPVVLPTNIGFYTNGKPINQGE